MTTALRYPPASLAGDYARAAVGLALTALPLALLNVVVWIAVPMAAAAVLFATFAARTARRHLSRLEVDGTAIVQSGPVGRIALPWDTVRRVDLRYYSTRHDRGDGWMQLTLVGPGGRLTVDSTLDGFDRVAERAAGAAHRNGVALSPVTIDNLLALGIDPEGDAS